MSPFRHRQGKPVAECLETEVEQPLRLTLHFRYKTDHILVKTRRHNLRVDIAGKPILIFRLCSLPESLLTVGDVRHPLLGDVYICIFLVGLHNTSKQTGEPVG